MRFFKRPIIVRAWHLYATGLLIGLALAGIVVVVVIGLAKLGDFAETNRELSEANARSIRNNSRLDRLEQPPTEDQLTAAALRALAAIRSCARRPDCRRRNPGVVRANRAIGSGRIPRPADDTNSGSGSSGSGGGTTSGGNGTTTTSPPSRGPTAPARRPQPTTSAPSQPTPTPTRPPAAPAPRPPATPTVTTPPVTPPRAPTPTVSVPPATTPPVATPPVTVPPIVPPVRVCAPPLIVVNCRDPRGRIVAARATVDPVSSSGHGSKDDPLCDRLELPCDENGQPVFPPGVIRLPLP